MVFLPTITVNIKVHLKLIILLKPFKVKTSIIVEQLFDYYKKFVVVFFL